MESVASSWFGNLTRLRFRSGAGDDQSEMSAGTAPPCRRSSAVANENVRRRVLLCTLSGRTHGRLELSQRLLSIMVRQTIIEFIIGSRIRDFGADLGPNAADLGPLI